MTLTPAFLDELRARTHLSGLIGKSVKLQRAGREWRACCPFHNEKSPSFYVNDDKGFYHCLASETVVLTRKGRAQIGDLSGSTAEILGPSGRWIAAPFSAYGTQRLWAIELSRNGVRKSILATSRHRWFTRGRRTEVLTSDLRPGARLEAVTPDRRSAWEIDPDGVRHGLVFGDGTMYHGKYGTINLHGPANMALASWFPDQRHALKERAPGKPYLQIYGGRAFDGMKRLPDPRSSEAYLLGFLAGYLAADGHVAKDGTVMLHSANPAHLQAVRDISSTLGIVTYGRTTQSRRGIDDAISEIYRIHFAASSLVPEMFLMTVARERFESHSKAFDRLRWTVRGVTPTDRIEQVYCAQVPEDHAFALDDDILTGNCFGCGAHGDAIRWMTEQRGLPFIDAVKELAQAAGLDMPEQDRHAAERAERAKGLHEAMADAAQWFTERLYGIEGGEARALLHRRGIREETARTFGMGFAPDSRGKLKDALKTYGDAMLVEAGLLISVEGKEPYDRFRGRLMIPIRDQRGRVIAFGGRVIGDGEPKYLNSPDTPLFDKGRTLYNLDRAQAAARKSGRVIAVEGYMDVIALAQAGFGEAVAPLGTALTEHQLARLWRMAEVPLLCFDGDAAGQKAAIRAAHRALPLLEPGRSLAFVTIPDGMDPDDLIRAKGAGAFEALLAKPEPLVNRIWSHELAAEPLETPEARAGLRKRLSALAQTIADPSVRQEYLAEFRRRFDDHFAPAPREFRPRERGRPGGGPRGGWREPPRPVGAVARGVGTAGIDPVLAKAVLAGLIRHPAEIARHMEVLGSLRSVSGALGRLFDAVIDVAVEQRQLDSADILTILGRSGFGGIADELLRADGLNYSFNRAEPADADRAREDLNEAITVMVERPAVDAALAEATASVAEHFTDEAFARQVALLQRRQELEVRLANLTLAEEENFDE
ncbi:DNA primase [Sphingomonas canadensis]|uniref:DNA primase n=1 Tax=Sphingomonas canadensis TaxID=1219257 RepID=A0ABW3H789_9SPHN